MGGGGPRKIRFFFRLGCPYGHFVYGCRFYHLCRRLFRGVLGEDRQNGHLTAPTAVICAEPAQTGRGCAVRFQPGTLISQNSEKSYCGAGAPAGTIQTSTLCPSGWAEGLL